MPVPSILRKTKNRVFNFTPSQIKVREATSNDPNGPSEAQLVELGVISYSPHNLDEILAVLIKRINDDGKNWRHILKSLIVFEFLCIHGSPKMLDYCQRNKFYFESLKVFEYYDKDHHDHGSHVRDRANRFCNILDNETAFNEIKEKTKVYTQYVSEGLNFNQSSVASNQFSKSDQNISNSANPMRAYGSSAISNSSLGQQQYNKSSPRSLESRQFSHDISQIMPSSKDEEESQLQLALALSKEESYRKNTIATQTPIKVHQKQIKSATTIEQPKSDILVDDLLDLNFDTIQPNRTQSTSFGQQSSSFDPFIGVQQSNQTGDQFGSTSQFNQFQDPFRSSESANTQVNTFTGFQQAAPSFDPFAGIQQSTQQRDAFSGFQQPVNFFDQPNVQSQSQTQTQLPQTTNVFASSSMAVEISGKSPQYSFSQVSFSTNPSTVGNSSTQSNQVVNDFLGDFGSKLVNMDAFETSTTYGMRHNFNKSNPFVGFEEVKPSISQTKHSSVNNQFDSPTYNPFNVSTPHQPNDPFSISKTYQVTTPNSFNPNSQRNN